jgi:hypothetical protein
MTQGIAQRVIEQYARDMDGSLRGAMKLHAELSAEARRVLDEKWNEPELNSTSSSLIEWTAMKQICERLGLDLNEPESES